MDARELRIGNLIGMNLEDDDQNFFKVLEVAQESMKTGACGMRFDLTGEIHYHDADFFEPIPITNELLYKLGAIDFPSGKMLSLCDRLLDYMDCRDVWIDAQTSVELKYVHQVQNFIYATKGIDLLERVGEKI